jgi:hypothetical protein
MTRVILMAPTVEQMRTHYKQPQFAFETNWRIWTLCEPQPKNLKCLLKLKGTIILKNLYQASPVLTKPFKTTVYRFQTILSW